MIGRAAATIVLVACTAACGVPDATLQHRAEMPGDHEVGENTGALHANAASTWFPMEEGNEWTFAGDQGSVHTIRVEYRDGNLMWVSGLRKAPTWFGHSAAYPNNLYVWNEGAQTWGYHSRFGFLYTPWLYQPSTNPCERYRGERVDSGVEVKTPAGVFSGARTIGYTYLTPKDKLCPPLFGMRSITYAPDVGPVRFVSSATNETFLLTHARVGETELPVAPVSDLRVEVSSNAASYVNVPNTIRCITWPCPSNAVTAEAVFTLDVTHTATTSRTYTFSSGQQFDFELIDQNGKVVKAWSDDRGFTQALTYLTFGAGETARFTGTVSLEDRQGQQLEGTYTVLGRFRAMGEDATAVTTLTVSIAE